MSFDEDIELGHLLFFDRKCRVCGKVKNLLDDFYLSRKGKKILASAYSYECKDCTIKRITEKRKEEYNPVPRIKDVYPDW